MATIPVPGTIVAAGSQVGPSGDTGITAPAPLADATKNGLLRQVSGNTTDFVDGTNNCQPLQPVIWSARLRSFNAIGNPTFEVDQRNVGNAVTLAGGTVGQDRWVASKGPSAMAATGGQTDSTSSPILLPGTNFAVSSKFFRVTLTTAQATLAAGDLLYINQQIEGIQLRELIGDAHSISLLVRSSVAGLNFGMALRDTATTHSLTKLCSIPSAGTWTLIPLANLVKWTAAGTWSLAPGVIGYTLSIGLAIGSTYIAPANDTWQNGNFVGALGQSNFAASPVNSTFDIAFVQHEPGPLCTTLIDLPWEENLNRCKRYYCSNYAYGTLKGSANAWTTIGQFTSGTTGRLNVQFPREMAKSPTVTAYGVAGAINQLYINSIGDQACGAPAASAAGLNSVIFNAAVAAGGNLNPIMGNYVADTGW